MPTYAGTVVHNSTGKREEIEVQAESALAAEQSPAIPPNVLVGRVMEIDSHGFQHRIESDAASAPTGTPTASTAMPTAGNTDRYLAAIERRLSHIFVLLLLVMVVVPIALFILIAVVSGLQ